MKSKGRLIATFILTIFTVPLVAFAVKAAVGYDATKPMSITVKADDGGNGCLDKSAQYGSLVYDLYEIKAPEVKGMTQEQIDAFSFEDYAQEQLMVLMRAGKVGNDATCSEAGAAKYEALTLNSKENIEPGYYLLIARAVPKDAESVKYCATAITQVAKIAADGTSKGTQYATYSRIGSAYFTIAPQIVAVPTKVDENGNVLRDPTKEGTWVYDQQITLKMIADPESGAIQINKLLTGIYSKDESVPFVFQVDVFYPDENTLFSSEIYTMIFTKTGKEKLLVQGIPLGSLVKIYEVYSGANYVSSIRYPNCINVTVNSSDAPVAVNIKNDYNYGDKGEGGLTNHFTYEEGDDGIKWYWEQLPDGNVNSTNGRVQKTIEDILRQTTRR